MVRVTYVGLGSRDAAVSAFDALLPHVLGIRALQAKCWPWSADDKALQIAIEGLEDAAYHFTRRPFYFEATRVERQHGQNFYEGLGERAAAIAAFETLSPYARALGALQQRCRPFGRDYLALDIPRLCLDSAAYHFTKEAHFYGAKADSAGPIRRWP
jgi:hypothetical protein